MACRQAVSVEFVISFDKHYILDKMRLQEVATIVITFCIIGTYSIRIQKFAESRSSRTIEYKNDNKTNINTYKYEIKKFRVPVDHFSFSLNDTFEIRYLVNNTWQNGKYPPIFFYTGNEGHIETFAENTGFMWEIAPHFGALIIFAEHRYYGESLPYGNKSYADVKNRGYLTSQQALADYVDLIQFIKSEKKMKHSPVIAFGGSYGGMLSAWFRMKYPHIIQGAIAASAPILQFTGVTDCHAFFRIVTSDFGATNPTCPKEIRKSWDSLNNLFSTEEGKKWISTEWKLCKPLNNATDLNELKLWLSNVYTNLAMVDYPYESNFLAPLPGHPINKFCEHLTNNTVTDKETLFALGNALNLYTNYTGKTICIETDDAAPALGAGGWDYQACSEMVMPMCTDGINDMFEPQPWNFEEFAQDCEKKFSIRPAENLICEVYGCLDLSTASNIVFSNGLLDPWSSGGVLRNLSSSAQVIIIPGGAHHLDLRGSNEADPFSVVEARKFHEFSIMKWIKQYRNVTRKNPI